MSQQPKRTQIPIEGGSGLIPSGAMQFENDWPGLFLRGDNAVTVSHAIRQLLDYHGKKPPGDLLAPLMILEDMADVIDNDVMVKPDEFST